MAPLIKFAVGVAGTALIATMAYKLGRSSLLSDLGSRSAMVMVANGITDGRARWTTDNGWTWRIARLSGTADAATQRRTRDAVAGLAGISDATWDDLPNAAALSGAATYKDVAACRARIETIIKHRPINFEPYGATPEPSARPLFDAIAQTLLACPSARIHITGHAHTAGTSAVNMALSRARAEAVAMALTTRGIRAESLSTAASDQKEPPNTAAGDETHARDHCITFTLQESAP